MALSPIYSTEIQTVFGEAHEHAANLYARADDAPALPPIERFGEELDFAGTAEQYLEMKERGLNPEVVFALTTLNLLGWRQIYQSLQDDQEREAIEVAQGARLKNGGLKISRPAIEHDRATVTKRVPFSIRGDGESSSDTYDLSFLDLAWTMRIIEGSDQAELTFDRPTWTDGDKHRIQTAEYLALQALLIQRGDAPVDLAGNSYTLLGKNSMWAFDYDPTIGTWSNGLGSVRLDRVNPATYYPAASGARRIGTRQSQLPIVFEG